MKPLKSIFLILLIIVSCKNTQQHIIVNEEVSSHTPFSVELNLEDGSWINAFTGDTIQPIINSLGDTVKTGKPVQITGEIIDLGNVKIPEKIKPRNPLKIKTDSNIHPVPEKLTVVPFSSESTKFYKTDINNLSGVHINSIGDTVFTGIPVTVMGKNVPGLQPHPVQVQFPAKKDIANIDIRYMDVEQGLGSSYVLSVYEDKKGNLWLGTIGGGVCKYNGESFTHFTTANGLSSNDVWAITEDYNGNIWFGTSGGGACKFDGDTFTHFTEKEGFSNNHILAIFEDSKNNIWFGTNDGGAAKYDGKTFTFFTKNEGLSDIIRGITEDKNGNIWFGSYTEGAFMFDGTTITQFTAENGISNNSVMPLLEDRNGNIWIGTWGGGVCMFDGKNFTHFTIKEGLCHNGINALAEDKKGNIWIGTWEGLSKYDGKNFTNFTEKDGLSNNDVKSIYIDDNDVLWLGTWGGGFNIFNENGLINITEKDGLQNRHVLSILEDNANNIWFGTWEGISVLDDTEFINYSKTNETPSEFGYSLLQDSRGTIWVGTELGGIMKIEQDYITRYNELEELNNYINSLVEDDNKTIWIATERNGLLKFDGEKFERFGEKEGFSNDKVRNIIKAKNGDLWIATLGGGIARFDGESFVFYTEKEGLSSNKILSVFEDRIGNIWIGTDGGGLNRFNGNSFLYFSEKDGLSDNSIRSIAEDKNGNLWIGTENGLNLLAFQDENENSSAGNFRIYQYNIQDGLKGMDFNQNSILLDSKNRLWAGTGKSLTMLNLDNFKPQDDVPKIQFNRLEINEQFIDYRHIKQESGLDLKFDSVARFSNYPINPVIPHYYNHLTFYFSANHGGLPNDIKYSYKIDGLNNNWSLPSTESKADYRNLPHGENTIKIRAIGKAQIWSEPFEYTFTILRPWWDTTVARLGYVIGLILMVLLIVRLRTASINKRRKELIEIVDELKIANERALESDRLKSAFLLNLSHEIRTPMNGILGFTDLLNEPGLSGEMQQKYIKYIQQGGNRMLNTVTNLVEISRIETGLVKVVLEEMNVGEQVREICKSFVEEAENKGLKLKYFDTLAGAEKMIITDASKFQTILKQLIQNAIKFTNKGEIEVGYQLLKTEDNIQLEFYIKDTGIGIPANRKKAIFSHFVQADIEDRKALQGSGIGLSIAKAYVNIMGGKIWVESEEEQGSTFFFIIPVKPVKTKEQEVAEVVKPADEVLKSSKIKILIAEDDDPSYLHLSILLRNVSGEIIRAKDGIEAVELCKTNPDLDIILMDIKMPKLDGYDATKQIREFNKNVSIIAQTAYALAGDREKTIEAGCNDYITKPVKKEDLLALIEKYI